MDPTEAGPPNDAGGAGAGPEDAQNPAADPGAEGAKEVDPFLLNFNVPLPETVHIERMGRISEVKSIWRSGIKQIEEIFSDHIAKINDLFDERALEYDKIRD